MKGGLLPWTTTCSTQTFSVSLKVWLPIGLVTRLHVDRSRSPTSDRHHSVGQRYTRCLDSSTSTLTLTLLPLSSRVPKLAGLSTWLILFASNRLPHPILTWTRSLISLPYRYILQLATNSCHAFSTNHFQLCHIYYFIPFSLFKFFCISNIPSNRCRVWDFLGASLVKVIFFWIMNNEHYVTQLQ